jgi:hypothetical protein
MKIKLILFVPIFLALSSLINAQSCEESFYTFKSGAYWEMANFNEKGKPTGHSSYEVKSISNTGTQYKASVTSKAFDEKDKELMSSDFEVACSNGNLTIDMKSLFSAQQQQQFKDMTMKMSGTDLSIPNALTVGQVLPDGIMNAEIYSGTTLFSKLTFVSTERKVLAKESITVPAGTYECYKITSKFKMTNVVAGIPIKYEFSVVEWYAFGVGMVRSETYNKSEKMMGYTVLSKLTK